MSVMEIIMEQLDDIGSIVDLSIHNIKEREQLLIVSQKERIVYCLIKRIFDIFSSIIALVLLFPLLILVSLIIKLEDGGSVFYWQERCGKNGKIFKMYKFRSMCMNADEYLEELEKLNERDGPTFKIKNDPRVTKVGKVIRKYCIDELPQLLNVIKGDMSIVGPRPGLPKEISEYTDYDRQRLNVKQGLTCYWQVSREKEISFSEWIEMDLEYIKNRSLKTDMKLIGQTFILLITGGGGN